MRRLKLQWAKLKQQVSDSSFVDWIRFWFHYAANGIPIAAVMYSMHLFRYGNRYGLLKYLFAPNETGIPVWKFIAEFLAYCIAVVFLTMFGNIGAGESDKADSNNIDSVGYSLKRIGCWILFIFLFFK